MLFREFKDKLDEDRDIDVRWQRSIVASALIGEVPLVPSMLSRAANSKMVEMDLFHTTDIEGLRMLVGLQGTRKAISATPWIGSSMAASGVHRKGVLVKFRGLVHFFGHSDVFSMPVSGGIRAVPFINFADTLLTIAAEIKAAIGNQGDYANTLTRINAATSSFAKAVGEAKHEFIRRWLSLFHDVATKGSATVRETAEKLLKDGPERSSVIPTIPKNSWDPVGGESKGDAFNVFQDTLVMAYGLVGMMRSPADKSEAQAFVDKINALYGETVRNHMQAVEQMVSKVGDLLYHPEFIGRIFTKNRVTTTNPAFLEAPTNVGYDECVAQVISIKRVHLYPRADPRSDQYIGDEADRMNDTMTVAKLKASGVEVTSKDTTNTVLPSWLNRGDQELDALSKFARTTDQHRYGPYVNPRRKLATAEGRLPSPISGTGMRR